MSRPRGFTWIEQPLLAAHAQPEDIDELRWLRKQGIELLVSLTEDPPRRDWINDAGLLLLHLPVEDMHAPTPEQLGSAVSSIGRALEGGMGVAVHCTAGLGRTGVVLACYFVSKNLSAKNAIARVRRLRPGSIETDEQEEAVVHFAQRLSASNS